MGIAQCQRHRLDRTGDGAPDLDNGEAAFQQILGLFRRQEITHPLWAGFLGVVVVHEQYRFAHLFGRALILILHPYRVIEHMDAAGTGRLPDQFFDFRVVDALDLVGIEEIADLGVVAP